MNPTQLLQDLINAIDGYDNSMPARKEMEGQHPTAELIKYWDAVDHAKVYLRKVNQANDDLGS